MKRVAAEALGAAAAAQRREAGQWRESERAELRSLVVLCSLPQMGPARIRVLLEGRAGVEAVEALRSGQARLLAALSACSGVNESLITTWRNHLASEFQRAAANGKAAGEDRLNAHERAGIWLHTPPGDDETRLWEGDPEPPPILFGRGQPIDADMRRVGIVGTRRCTAYGRTVAQLLGAGLAAEGVAVVSGLATGIDGIAQRAALDAGGRVVGVVGSGLDCVYPAANRSLWADLAQHGSLLSEHPLGTPAAPWRFPARNRIVAALSEVLVVVESGPTGGSMYTVDAATERNRPVMAVPGPITSAASAGTNRLIVDGCAPVCGVSDVLLALGADARTSGAPVAAHSTPQGISHALPDDLLDRQILDELMGGPRSVDELILRVDVSLAGLSSALARLQLSGWVLETGGWWEKAR